jgi:hypothetical protein
VLDPALGIAVADQQKVRDAATAWLAWYDSVFAEPVSTMGDPWVPSRLEYAMSVAARLSPAADGEVTFSAREYDGDHLDWSSFDLNKSTNLGTATSAPLQSLVSLSIPTPVTFRGAPAARFWEMEDSNVAYGLVPVGPTDLTHLMLIEYASTYGNDWYTVPLNVPVGSVTRVDSLVVTDTFGVRTLLRPLGDPALHAPYFSMWQCSILRAPGAAAQGNATNRFFLAPTLPRTLDSTPVEDVLFMRDEMANLAWAIERSAENPIEQAVPRVQSLNESEGSPPSNGGNAGDTSSPARYVLSSTVPRNWVPLLPVQLTNPPGQILKQGAVLQPDGSQIVYQPVTEVLKASSNFMLFDEEVPREGVHVTRRRSLARWSDGSTWLWTSFQADVGTGEGSSGLRFDQIQS